MVNFVFKHAFPVTRFTWIVFLDTHNLVFHQMDVLDNTSCRIAARTVNLHTMLILALTLSFRVFVLCVVWDFRRHFVYFATVAILSENKRAHNQLIPCHRVGIGLRVVVSWSTHIWRCRWMSDQFYMECGRHLRRYIVSISRNQSKIVGRRHCPDRPPDFPVWCHDECNGSRARIQSNWLFWWPT